MNKGRIGESAKDGQLTACPQEPDGPGAAGLHSLSLQASRDGLVYMPHSYNLTCPMPLVLMLHGAGGDAHQSMHLLRSLADSSGFILLAPDSRRQTWDIILGRHGPDVVFLDESLKQTFRSYTVDPKRIAIAGFSDGASYALSLGITNGGLFTHVIAFSPGFLAPAGRVDSPPIFVSHGTRDEVLPIGRCSRSIVPQLRKADFDVIYMEFDGGHAIPEAVSRRAVEWTMEGKTQDPRYKLGAGIFP